MTVSQAPVVSEAAATVAPPVVEGTVTALPSAVQDLARFFLSLTGSSSQGAVGSVAVAAVPTPEASAPGVGAVASCAVTAPSAGAERPPHIMSAILVSVFAIMLALCGLRIATTITQGGPATGSGTS